MNTIPPVQPTVPANHATANPLPTGERFHDLRQEQIVRATVAEGGQDEVMLELSGHRLRAQTRVPLQKGQTLDLLVASTSPRLELRIIQDMLTQRLGQSLHLLEGPWKLLPPVRQLLFGENPVFAHLSPSAKVGLELWLALQGRAAELLDGGILRQLARSLGLDFEAHLARGDKEEALATLKGALLETLQKFPDSDGPEGQIRHPLQALELFQLCQLRLAGAGQQLIPLPLPFLEQGFLLVEQGERQEVGAEGGAFRFSLHLSLEGLGPLRVDFLRDEQGLFLRFHGETAEKTQFLAAEADQLREALGPLLQGLSFVPGAESPATALVRQLSSDGRAILDTRI